MNVHADWSYKHHPLYVSTSLSTLICKHIYVLGNIMGFDWGKFWPGEGLDYYSCQLLSSGRDKLLNYEGVVN